MHFRYPRCYKRLIRPLLSHFEFVLRNSRNNKMNLCSFKVFLCLLVGYNLFTVVTPLAPERTFHHGLRQRAEFGEGIRDWFRGVKDRVRHFFKPTTTTPPPPVELEPYKQEIMNKLLLDIANTRFNPDRDWGFRMGNWYIIRKVDDSSNDKLPNYVSTTTTESIDEFTREREELITSTSAPSAVYTEEIETLEHGHVGSTSMRSVENTEEIETLEHGHGGFTSMRSVENTEIIETTQSEPKEFTTYATTSIPEPRVEDTFSSTQEYVVVSTTNAIDAATTEIIATEPKQDRENEIPVKGPQSAEVISP